MSLCAGIVLFASSLCFIVPTLSAQATPVTVPLELRVAGTTPLLVTALRIGDEGLLPVAQIFQFIQLPYSERVGKGDVVIDRRHIVIQPGDSVRLDDEKLYATSAYLAQLLHATISVDWSQLAVTLTDDTLLPTSRRRERALRIQRLRSLTAPREVVDSLDDSTAALPHMTGVMTVDYGATFLDHRSVGTYFTKVGISLFGGMLTSDIQHYGLSRTVWTKAQDRVPFFRQLLIGDVPTFGNWSSRLRGITLSNAPIVYSDTYDTMHVAGVVLPDWEIDVERAGELVATDSGGSDGHYSVAVPITYGMAPYTVIAYGPDGEVHRETHLVTVPEAQLPLHRYYYALNVGRCLGAGCHYAIEGHMRFAPVSRVTLSTALSSVVSHVMTRSSVDIHVTPTVNMSEDITPEGDCSTLFQYDPSLTTSLWIRHADATTSYGMFSNGSLGTLGTIVNVTGTHRSVRSALGSVTRIAMGVRGQWGQLTPFVQQRRFVVGTRRRSHLDNGMDMWMPLTPRIFLRAHAESMERASTRAVEAALSVLLPGFTRLDLQTRWRLGATHPAIVWSVEKTAPFAMLRSVVSTIPGMTRTAAHYIGGSLRFDPWTQSITASPNTQVANVPLVTTLR